MQKIVVLDNGSSSVPYILIAFGDHRIVLKFILPIFYQKKNPIFIIIFQVKCEFSPWTPCSKSCGGLAVQTQSRPVWEPHLGLSHLPVFSPPPPPPLGLGVQKKIATVLGSWSVGGPTKGLGAADKWMMVTILGWWPCPYQQLLTLWCVPQDSVDSWLTNSYLAGVEIILQYKEQAGAE